MSGPPPGFDPADWKAWPHTPWAFRNIDRFLPVATVSAPARPGPLPVQVKDDGFDWESYLAAVHATSALLVRDGRITFETYRQGMQPDDRHTLFSITKSIVGLIALLLIHRRVIESGRTADHYVPELKGSAFGQARIGDLLAMRDGVPFGEDYGDPAAEVHRYSRYYWGGAPGGTLHALAGLSARAARPGSFAYRTPVADVIAWVLRGATSLPLASLVSELLWQPIGAEADAHFILDTEGVEIGGTGFTARPRDLARLAALLLNRSDGALPQAVTDQLFAGGDPGAVERAGYVTRTGWSYAGLWWHPGERRIAALGVHGQRLMIDKQSRTALIVTAAAPRPDTRALDRYHVAACSHLLDP